MADDDGLATIRVFGQGSVGPEVDKGQNAARRAYNVIKRAILNGEVEPGARLREIELTELCGVSRTPVREALRRLEAEGLVTTEAGHGVRVIKFDEDEMEELDSLRAMIESFAAQRAASRITAEQIERLKSLAATMEIAAASSDAQLNSAWARTNSEFHSIVIEAADSPRLRTLATIIVHLPLMLSASNYSQADHDRSTIHHRDLISALETRNGPWAGAIMYGHVAASAAARKRILEEHPLRPPTAGAANED